MPSSLAPFGCGPAGACEDTGAPDAEGLGNPRDNACIANLGRLLTEPGDGAAAGASVEPAEVRGDNASSSALVAERFDPTGCDGSCRAGSRGGSEDEWAWDAGVS